MKIVINHYLFDFKLLKYDYSTGFFKSLEPF